MPTSRKDRPAPSSPVAIITLENADGEPSSPWRGKLLGVAIPRVVRAPADVVAAAKATGFFPSAFRRGEDVVRRFPADDWTHKVGPEFVGALFGQEAVVQVPEFAGSRFTGRPVLKYLDESIEDGIGGLPTPAEVPPPATASKGARSADPGTAKQPVVAYVGQKVRAGDKTLTVDWVSPSGDSVRMDGGLYVSTREEAPKVGAEGARRIVDRINKAAEEANAPLPAAALVTPAVTSEESSRRLSKYTPDQWGPRTPVELPPELLSDRKLPKGLLAHQEQGARWLDAAGRGLLADQPGLGKTVTTSVVIDAPAIVVCPKSVKQNWRAELNKWRPDLGVYVVDPGKPISDEEQEADVIIISYDSLASNADWLMARRNKTLVADEAQMLSTLQFQRVMRTQKLEPRGSERGKVFYEMAIRIPRLFLLSATPFTNSPKELFALLHMINPIAWEDPVIFEKRVATMKNLPALYADLNGTYMIRRLKEILPDFPEKVRGTTIVSLSDDVAETYEHACQNFLEWVLANGGPRAALRSQQNAALGKLNLLRALAALGKVKAATEWIEDYVSSNVGSPLVVMAYHKETFAALASAMVNVNARRLKEKERAIRYAFVTGETSEKQRNAHVSDFQSKKLDVLFYSVGMAVGVTLTASSQMLILERLWTPAKMEQAEDRIHRLGSKNTCVITYMDAAGTVDVQMADVLRLKTMLFSGAIEGKPMTEREAFEAVYGKMFARPKGEMERNLAASESEGIVMFEGVLRSQFSSWDKPV